MCASSCIKQYVQPSYGCRGMPVVAGSYVFILCEKIISYLKCNFKKVLEQERKNFFLNEQKSRAAAAKKYRYKRSRDK